MHQIDDHEDLHLRGVHTRGRKQLLRFADRDHRRVVDQFPESNVHQLAHAIPLPVQGVCGDFGHE